MTGRWALDEGDVDEDAGGLIRPYMITGGRTRAALPDLALQTLIGAAPTAHPGLALTPESGRIVALTATDPLSIVDLSAHLELPVGVVRVLVGDLAQQRLVVVHDAPTTADINLVRRLISGVQSL